MGHQERLVRDAASQNLERWSLGGGNPTRIAQITDQLVKILDINHNVDASRFEQIGRSIRRI